MIIFHVKYSTKLPSQLSDYSIFSDKGVKVDLGIPYELWDKPSVEITNMKTQVSEIVGLIKLIGPYYYKFDREFQCESLIENHEGDIEEWYFNHQEIPLSKYLCSDRALKNSDDSCLNEALNGDVAKKDEL